MGFNVPMAYTKTMHVAETFKNLVEVNLSSEDTLWVILLLSYYLVKIQGILIHHDVKKLLIIRRRHKYCMNLHYIGVLQNFNDLKLSTLIFFVNWYFFDSKLARGTWQFCFVNFSECSFSDLGINHELIFPVYLRSRRLAILLIQIAIAAHE
jgi:hypothetical protein